MSFLDSIATGLANNPGSIPMGSPMDASYHPSSNTGNLPSESPADGSFNTGVMSGTQLGASPLSSTTPRVGR